MPTISYNGSGTTVSTAQVGFGQGLQVGSTKIDFVRGAVQLVNASGTPKLIGSFSGLGAYGSLSKAIKTLVFMSKTPCTIYIDQMAYNYDTVGLYVTFNKIKVSSIDIERDATGQNPDVFDFEFQASDDPDYRFSIQSSTQESQTEVLFDQESRAVNTYTQVVNLRGAKKIIVQGQSPTSAETGVATVTLEVYDPGSGNWNTLVPNQDLFTIAQGQAKVAEIGDTISKSPVQSQFGFISAPVGDGNPPIVSQILNNAVANANGLSALVSQGHILPSGASILRAKVVVATSSLTFSLSIIKVFN